jgi:hypothetical protein
MTAVGDSIRSKIDKPKKKTDQEIGEETYRAADHGSANEPCIRVAQPTVKIMEIDLPGGGAAKACRRRLARRHGGRRH